MLGEDAPSLATVYRTLQGLAEEGSVDSVNRNGEALYRLCGSAHHHHLVCVDCAATVELDGDEIENWAARNANEHGFTVTTHIAEIYGRCETCST
jgi:Fur family ferric uptake transcriptional regulator